MSSSAITYFHKDKGKPSIIPNTEEFDPFVSFWDLEITGENPKGIFNIEETEPVPPDIQVTIIMTRWKK
jgi:hypothetical protein